MIRTIIVLAMASAMGILVSPDVCVPTIGQHLNWYHHLKRPFPHNCIQLIATSSPNQTFVQCAMQQLSGFNFTFYTRSLDHVMDNVLDDRSPTVVYKYCSSIILDLDDSADLQNFLLTHPIDCPTKPCQRFYPHSSILVLLHKTDNLDDNQLDSILESGVHVFTSNQWLNGSLRYALLDQMISWNNTNRKQIETFVDSFQSHPLYFANEHEKLAQRRRKPLRIGLYDYPPFVIINQTDGDKKGSIDGLEYRFISEVTSSWPVRWMATPTKPDAWYDYSINQLKAGETDLAMSCVWLKKSRAAFYDLTAPFTFNCGTFLVPKPTVRDASTIVYESLTHEVWAMTLISFVICTLCLVGFAFVLEKDRRCERILYGRSDASRSALDLVGIATCHGLRVWPDRFSLKWIVCSWIVFCILVDAVYSTGYTMLLTKPRFTKPIDTLQEFVNNDYKWGCFEYNMDLERSNVTDYQHLFRLNFKEYDVAERSWNIRHDPKYAVYTDIIDNQYFTAIGTVIEDVVPRMRLMKSCVQSYYSTFGLKLNSPYTQYFNEKIATYKEAGILKHWMMLILWKNSNPLQRVLSEQLNSVVRAAYEPRALTLGNLKGSFWVLGILLTFSVLVFGLELLYNRYNRQ